MEIRLKLFQLHCQDMFSNACDGRRLKRSVSGVDFQFLYRGRVSNEKWQVTVFVFSFQCQHSSLGVSRRICLSFSIPTVRKSCLWHFREGAVQVYHMHLQEVSLYTYILVFPFISFIKCSDASSKSNFKLFFFFM